MVNGGYLSKVSKHFNQQNFINTQISKQQITKNNVYSIEPGQKIKIRYCFWVKQAFCQGRNRNLELKIPQLFNQDLALVIT